VDRIPGQAGGELTLHGGNRRWRRTSAIADGDDLRLKRVRLLEREAPRQFQQQRWFDVRDCAHGSTSAKAQGLEHEGIAAHQHIDADAEVLSMHGQGFARVLDALEAGGGKLADDAAG
jgi:hypothetical protein